MPPAFLSLIFWGYALGALLAIPAPCSSRACSSTATPTRWLGQFIASNPDQPSGATRLRGEGGVRPIEGSGWVWQGWARYRGHAFFVETTGSSEASISLESNDPEVAEALSLDGHQRDCFSVVIPTSELREVIEEITVRYKTGVPSL